MIKKPLEITLLVLVVVSIALVAKFKFNPGVQVRSGEALIIKTVVAESEIKKISKTINYYGFESVGSAQYVISGKDFDQEKVSEFERNLKVIDDKSTVESFNYITNRFGQVAQRAYMATAVGLLMFFVYIAWHVKGEQLTRGQVVVFALAIVVSMAVPFIIYLGLSAALAQVNWLVTDLWYVTATLGICGILVVNWLLTLQSFKIFLTRSQIEKMAKSWQIFIAEEQLHNTLMISFIALVAFAVAGGTNASFLFVFIAGMVVLLIHFVVLKYITERILSGLEYLQENSKILQNFFEKEWK